MCVCVCVCVCVWVRMCVLRKEGNCSRDHHHSSHSDGHSRSSLLQTGVENKSDLCLGGRGVEKVAIVRGLAGLEEDWRGGELGSWGVGGGSCLPGRM